MAAAAEDHDDAPDTRAPDPDSTRTDPEAFRKAHERYGGYLTKGGLPFEPEELDDDAERDRASAQRADEGGEAPPAPDDAPSGNPSADDV